MEILFTFFTKGREKLTTILYEWDGHYTFSNCFKYDLKILLWPLTNYGNFTQNAFRNIFIIQQTNAIS